MKPYSKIVSKIGKNRGSLFKGNETSASVNKVTKDTVKINHKISIIKQKRNEIKDDYIRSTTRRNVIPKWKEVVKLLQALDIRLLLVSLKVLGDMYVEFDDYENARNIYGFYKTVSFRLELLEETMYSYECLGKVYKFLYQYNKAIMCYKKMIELAWILNNRPAELRAYDNIGIQYFYLGDKEKAKYFHERMLYGLYEKETKLKENIVENFKNKYYNLFNDDRQLIKQVYSNDELKEQFIRHISLYETEKKVIDLETYDLLSNQDKDMMKDTYVEEIDMNFQIIYEKYLTQDYLSNVENNNKKKNKYEKYKKKKTVYRDSSKNEKDELNNINNLILSHLSNKRKDFNNERFEKNFERFDLLFKEFCEKIEKENNK
jgi:hypothetical protein